MGLLDDLVRGTNRKAKKAAREISKDVNEFIDKHDLDDKFEDAKEATIKGVVKAANAIEKGTPVVTAKVAKTVNKGVVKVAKAAIKATPAITAKAEQAANKGAKKMATTAKKAVAKKKPAGNLILET